MSELPKKQLSPAEVYGEKALRTMEKYLANCNVFNDLFRSINNHPQMTSGGVGKDGMNLVVSYILKLEEIHKPHCKQKALH
ncbi:hypothetical protein CANDROIZ_210024 [Candidatus Roizmanbacteria bacterium]|nr:hypothetical protein CANDROIZ_210024 [Candidatus Roizmanbacteria bacterium]